MNADDAARLRRLTALPSWDRREITRRDTSDRPQRWETVLLAARRLVGEHRIMQARVLLDRRLAEIDLTGCTGDRSLLDVILLFSHLPPAAPEDPDRRLAAARFAYTSATAYGDPDRRLLAGDLLGHVAHDHGAFRLAADVLAELWHWQHDTGHAHDPGTVRLRLRLAASLHHGGRCGEALRHTSRSWQDWIRQRIRNPRDGARISVAYARVLVGCRLRHDADGLLGHTRHTAPSLEPVLEPLLTLGSPTAAGIVAAHQPVCARRFDTDGIPDLAALYAADQAWTTDTRATGS